MSDEESEIPKSKFWAIRINFTRFHPKDKCGFQEAYDFTRIMLEQRLSRRTYVRNATYQLERGKNQIRHWQLYVEFKTSYNKYQVKSTLGLLPGEYWQPCDSPEDYRNYCRKDATRIAGPFEWPRPISSNALSKIVKYI